MFAVNQKSIDSFLYGIDGTLMHNEPMAKHSPWNVGGTAQCYFPPSNKTSVVQLMCQLPGNISVQWLGSGSNTLVRDGGLSGVTLDTSKGLSSIRRLDERTLYVEAGTSNVSLLKFCADKGLGGLAFLESASGTFGGAIAMGSQTDKQWNVVVQLECVNRDGDIKWCSLVEFRAKQFAQAPKHSLWILGAKLELDLVKSKKSILSVLQRFHTQPFKTKLPPTGIYAQTAQINPNRLLHNAGLAGLTIGGAAYKIDKPNDLIVNHGAKVKDVERLVEYGRTEVKKQFNVDLNVLINFVGDAV